MSELLLRDVRAADLEQFFADQREPLARQMAAFGAEDQNDRQAFDEKWQRILSDESIVTRSIECEAELAGYYVSFEMGGVRQVGYWISREFWGRGVATSGLRLFLDELPMRPLHACAAADNTASIRVLEKCGFGIVRYQRGFARGRGEEIDEVLMVLVERAAD